MKIMISNNTGWDAGRLFGLYPDRIAHLHSVDAPREPRQGVYWAIDNGVFGAWSKGLRPDQWSEEPFYEYLEKYSVYKPAWAVVPDWVGDKDETIARWHKHSPAVKAYGVPLAFAVQDSMTIEDVPEDADVIFVGGTTSWKWSTLKHWTSNFKRVHVGRVNTPRLLAMAENAGAESVDGTGWMQYRKQTRQLEEYLEGSKHFQMELIDE